MFLVQNEQTKLTASLLSALAASLVAAGVFAPAAALLYRLTPLAIDIGYMFAIAFGCFALGAGLHLFARTFLRRLRE
ncbi:MAG: hypothetical protein ACREB8_11165 [Pseudolabrys sp.]